MGLLYQIIREIWTGRIKWAGDWISNEFGFMSCALGLLCFICWRKKVAGNTKDLGDNVTMDDELEKGIGKRRSQTTFAEGGKLGEGATNQSSTRPIDLHHHNMSLGIC